MEAKMPQLPNPKNIQFNGYDHADYLVQVAPMTEEDMEASFSQDPVEAVTQRYMWEATQEKKGKMRYEAAVKRVANKLMVQMHEAVLMMERALYLPLDGEFTPKFVRARIIDPAESKTEATVLVYGSQKENL